MLCLLTLLAIGCAAESRRTSDVADLARPILALDPAADWSAAFNALADRGPEAVRYLAESPALTNKSSPDSLDTLIAVSLLRLLANPATAPPLTVSCLETSDDLLHFDIRSHGQSLGPVVLAPDGIPSVWTDLFPGEFNHRIAVGIDLERDRLAMRGWYLTFRDRPSQLSTPRRLSPDDATLFAKLSDRLADRWVYDPTMGTFLIAWPAVRLAPPREYLIDLPTVDYNIVRAACVRLGQSKDPQIRRRLIELVGSPHPLIRHNATFALGFSADERIRDLIRRYNQTAGRVAPRCLLGVRPVSDWVANPAIAAARR